MRLTSAVVTSIALCGLWVPASAQTYDYTVTTSGTIAAGKDVLGLFGSVGSSLVGDSFTITQTVDNTLPLTQIAIFNESFLSGFASQPETISATINGHTLAEIAYPDTAEPYLSSLQLANGIESNNSGFHVDNFGASSGGAIGSNGVVGVDTFVYSHTDAFVPNLNFNRSFTHVLTAADTGSTTYTVALGVSSDTFLGVPSVMSLSAVPAVPEPSSYALLIVGTCLAGFLIRRRKSALGPRGTSGPACCTGRGI